MDQLEYEANEGRLFGRGSRVRKTVDYSEMLTEREWLKVPHMHTYIHSFCMQFYIIRQVEFFTWTIYESVSVIDSVTHTHTHTHTQAVEDGTLEETEAKKQRKRKRKVNDSDETPTKVCGLFRTVNKTFNHCT